MPYKLHRFPPQVSLAGLGALPQSIWTNDRHSEPSKPWPRELSQSKAYLFMQPNAIPTSDYSFPAQPKTSITTTTQILRQAETRKPRTVLGLACCSGRRRPVPAVAKRQDRRKEIKSGLLTLEELSKSYAFPAIIVWQA
jgi:hypothetical protein